LTHRNAKLKKKKKKKKVEMFQSIKATQEEFIRVPFLFDDGR